MPFRRLLPLLLVPLAVACAEPEPAPEVTIDTVPEGAQLCVDVRDEQTVLEPRRYFRQVTDITYDPDKQMTGDFWLPYESDGPTPVVLNIHGGGWTGGHKNLRNARLWGEYFACRGIAFFDIDYELAPENPILGQVQDTKCAIRYLKGEAAHWNLNPDRLFVSGGSAGGHLTAMLATTQYETEWDPTCSTHPQEDVTIFAAIPVYGVMDFVAIQEQRIELESMFAKATGIPHPTDAELYYFSPISHVNEKTAPMLFIQGTADPLVPWQQSVDMGKKMDGFGVYNRVALIPGGTHGYDAFFNSEQMRLTLEETEIFLDEILGGAQ